ncbi:MAG: hypothetical protein A3K18_22300 [Lentisphaerae bacterium RIFOXYA12_64_32]|nr:MAG: hypothetical protein A3K18_22300 [Lentisphaerae bacterium RIFOXYA12_64_32]
MPIYEYKCKKCGNRFEHLARRLAETAPDCPKCGTPKPVKQLSTFSARVAVAAPASPCASGRCPGNASARSSCASGACPFSKS